MYRYRRRWEGGVYIGIEGGGKEGCIDLEGGGKDGMYRYRKRRERGRERGKGVIERV